VLRISTRWPTCSVDNYSRSRQAPGQRRHDEHECI
jgi:hypothetical protein